MFRFNFGSKKEEIDLRDPLQVELDDFDLSPLWRDLEPQGGMLAKMLPLVAIVLNVIVLIVVFLKK